MKANVIIILLLLLSVIQGISQTISGTVYEVNEKLEKKPVAGLSIYWLGTTIGTVTSEQGKFTIPKNNIKDLRLVYQMIGFKTDTLSIGKNVTKIDHIIKAEAQNLNEVEIREKVDNYISKMNSRNVQVLNTGELYKAACCNLSESFETNASVDVSYSDAITGAKQIQLLGLSGIYSQIQTENIPSVRGLASTYGLNYIPGSWMESIQISKGTSSVINGFESITGQINVEYKKPATTDRVFVNLYGNSNGRAELNLNAAHKFTEKLSTLLMVHGDYMGTKINRINKTTINAVDDNLNFILDQDGNKSQVELDENFLDLPLVNNVNIFNRWDYINPGKFISRFGIKYMEENRNGGTTDYDKETFVLDTSLIKPPAMMTDGKKPLAYGFGLSTKRTELFWKNGIMFAEKPWKSLGIIVSGTNHEQTGFFGVNNYHGFEKSAYANLIYQSIIGSTDHKFSTGLSYIYDNYNEGYDQIRFVYNYQDPNLGHAVTMADVVTLSSLTNLTPVVYKWDRTESIPGGFFEYTYSHLNNFSLILGARADYHNKYGLFVTPRTNLRWQINETTIIRGSAGLGYRTANVIAENLSLLTSQRILPNDSVYNSLKQEKAVNYGINFTKTIKLFSRNAEFNLDLYRTDFINQVVVDLDKDPTFAHVYNLDGKSYSNSIQAQFSFEPAKRFTVLTAFRLNDVKQTTDGKLQQRALLPRYKGLITMSYATKFDKWKFDLTGQFNGSSRIAPQDKMPGIIQRSYDKSPEYVIVNCQVTKKFKKNLDVYLGAENLLNFVQTDPLTEPFIPYHTHFDTTMIWGPVVGRVVYGGLRYSFN